MQMRLKIKHGFCVMLIALLLMSVALPCFAEQKGTLLVKLEDEEKKPVNGVEIRICKIADQSPEGYLPANGFEHAGLSLEGIQNAPNEINAKAVLNYMLQQELATQSACTQNGSASFSELDLGIWLVFCQENQEYTFNPYFVFLPTAAGGELYYEITSAPKGEVQTDTLQVYVIKKWDDGNNAAQKRPDSVTVELLKDAEVFSRVVLSEENGWANTFSLLPKDGVYSVREQAVVDYLPQYTGDMETGFVITNCYNGERLPQTGQHWVPVLLLGIAGVGFVLLGIFELRNRKNEKKDQ